MVDHRLDGYIHHLCIHIYTHIAQIVHVCGGKRGDGDSAVHNPKLKVEFMSRLPACLAVYIYIIYVYLLYINGYCSVTLKAM